MNSRSRTVAAVVGCVAIIGVLIKLRTGYYPGDLPGIYMIGGAGALCLLFSARGRTKIDRTSPLVGNWRLPLPAKIEAVQFKTQTTLDAEEISRAVQQAAKAASEPMSTISIVEATAEHVNLVIKGLGGIVTQMEFSVSWSVVQSGAKKIRLNVGYYLIKQDMFLMFIPAGPKTAPGLRTVQLFAQSLVPALERTTGRTRPAATSLPASAATPVVLSPVTHKTPTGPSVEASKIASKPELNQPTSDEQLSDHLVDQALSDRQEAAPYEPVFSSKANATTPVEESQLPFYQPPREAALEVSARQGHESGEPGLDSHQVDEYSVHASGQKPARGREPKWPFSFSTMSRKSLGLLAAGAAMALLLLGIALGAGSWRTPPQTTLPAAVLTGQPAATPVPQVTTTQQVPIQPAVPAPVIAPPPAQPSSAAPVVQPGDLGLTSQLRPVDCTGKFATFYHSSIVPSAYAQDVQANLVSHPGSKYLVTLGSCSSLYPMSNSGTMIYAVYGGPFDTLAQACVAASRFADEAYVKVLDNSTPPDQAVRSCS